MKIRFRAWKLWSLSSGFRPPAPRRRRMNGGTRPPRPGRASRSVIARTHFSRLPLPRRVQAAPHRGGVERKLGSACSRRSMPAPHSPVTMKSRSDRGQAWRMRDVLIPILAARCGARSRAPPGVDLRIRAHGVRAAPRVPRRPTSSSLLSVFWSEGLQHAPRRDSRLERPI